VVAVDVLLDGELVETLKRPPWRVRLDLGPELRPHLLEVVALDELYGELGRAEQRLNVPRDPVEVEIAVEETPTGAGAVARIAWESLIGDRPSSVEIALDGRPLEVEDPARFELPAYDPELLHLVRAELEFGGAAVSTAELVFGGSWVGRSSGTLTATAIELTGGNKVKSPEDLRGSFERGGESLEVTVVEKELSEIVVVRTPLASELLADIAGNRPTVRTSADPLAADRFQATARRGWRAQFIWPVSRPGGAEGRRYDLFPHSQLFTERDADLAVLVGGARSPSMGGEVRLADAVAIAGLTASASNRRRAVVVLLGGESSDVSNVSAAVARRFLEYLRVPLFVFSVAPETEPSTWGEVVDVSTSAKLDKAIRRVLKALEAQRVVWLEGLYLPHEISLTDRARGIRLAGTGESAE